MPIVNIQGVGQVNFPDSMTREQINSAIEKEILPQFPEVQAQVPRGILGGAKDIGASFVSGLGSTLQVPGQLGELIGFQRTGDLPDQQKTGLQKIGQQVQTFGEEAKSPTLVAKEQLRARELEKAQGFFQEAGTMLRTTATDPALLTSFFAEQLPNFIGSYGIGAIGKGGAKVLMKEATEEALAKVGVRTAIAGNAVMQGTDIGYDTYQSVYKELRKQGVQEDEAQGIALSKGRVAALEAAGISLAATRLPGGASIERAMLGKGMPGTAGFLKSTLGETVSEALEEGGGAFAKQVGLKEVAPETDLLKGVGSAAALGGLGGALMGAPAGVVNAMRARAEAQQPAPAIQPPPPEVTGEIPVEPPVQAPVQVAPEPLPSGVLQPEVPVEEAPVQAAPVAPVEAPVSVVPPVETPPTFEEDPFKNYFLGAPEGLDLILQNRDRSTPASIAQMQDIASKLDYGRVSQSRDFGNGAPVVISDIDLQGSYDRNPDQPVAITGKKDFATLPDGTQIPMMYAVVENGTLLTSNNADGSRRSTYDDLNKPGLRAIAGNGRIAGITKAYSTIENSAQANKYKQDLINDAKNLGINPEVVKNMSAPVLVRVMPKSYLTPDIADLSNRPTAARLSPVETAKNDIRRFDLGGLEFNEDGTPSGKTLMQFINAMPVEERTELTDKSGRPTAQAMDRLANAIFQKAYGSDALIDLYAQAADPEAKTILNALARVAPKMAQLEGAGEYDVRNALIQAAELAVNAKRAGMKLTDAAKQLSMDVDPNAGLILDMFANNVRSGKRIGERLNALADEALAQTQAGTDMFGAVPKKPIAEVYKALQAPAGEPGLFEEPAPEAPKAEAPRTVTDDGGDKLSFPLFVDMADKGYKVLSFDNPRTYQTKGGNKYRTIEKDGVRLALNPGEVIFADPKYPNRSPMLGYGESNQITWHFIGVDPKQRKQGKATQAIKDLVEVADKNNYTLYGEPAQLEKGGMTAEQLSNFYSKFGFQPSETSKKVIIREPNQAVKAEVKPEPIDFDIDKPKEQIAKEIDGLTIPELAQWTIDNAPNSAAKMVATKVKKVMDGLAGKNMFPQKVKVRNGGSRWKTGTRGETSTTYGPSGTKFGLAFNGVDASGQADRLTGANYITILHELLHVATNGELRILADTSPIYKDLAKILAKVKKQVREDIAAGKKSPALTRIARGANTVKNPRELVSWGLTDTDFQLYLKDIKVGKQKNLFNELVDVFRRLLGINAEYETALEAVVRATDQILEKPVTDLAAEIGKTGVRFDNEQIATDEESIGERIAEKTRQALQKRKAPEDVFNDIDPGLMAIAQPLFYPQQKTIVDRINGMKGDFWKKVAQGVADQYRAIKDYTEEGYMQARMSKTVDGALEGLTFFGHVFNNKGALDIKQGTKGLMEIMKPIGKEVDRYQMWVALNREAQLPMEKRTKMPGIGELIKRRNEFAQGTIDGKPRLEVYEKVREDMNALNKSVLKVALDAGLIESSRQKIEDINSRDYLTTADKEILTRPFRDEIERIEAKKAMNVTEEDKQTLKDYRGMIRDINGMEDMVPEIRQELIQYYTDNPGAFERFSADINYIPFYRAMEDGDLQGASTASGLTNQQFSRELKGGERPYGDLMENTLRNWSHILSASMKNQAVDTTMKAAVDFGAAMPNLKVQYTLDGDGKVVSRSSGEIIGDGEVKPFMTTADKGTIKLMRDGQPVYYQVTDPMLMDSISSIGYMGPKSKFLDVARDFKNMLQFGVTVSPAFKVRNLFRDSVSALAVTDLKKNPFANVVNGWVASDRNNPAHISALAGGAIFNFGTAYEGDQSKLIKKLLDQGVDASTILDSPEKVKKGLTILWEKYKDWGNKSEAANRMALYNQLKEKGYDHLQASFYARDMLDFSMQGSWPAFRLAAQTIPFLNARVQGLYKLGRDGVNPTARVLYNTITGKEIQADDAQKARSFGYTTMAVAMASMLLYMAFKDDEEFQKREQWDRDNFWWIRLPGMDYAFRIPKPFEIGAFGTMAERTLEQIVDSGAEGKAFGDSIFRMLTDTFAMNPVPQFVRPIIDLYANKDAFTGAPIESAGMERLSKQERVTDNTSPIAQALGGISTILGEKGQLSPVQVDYAIKAYFGWLGGTATQASVYAVQPFKDGAYPDVKIIDKVSQGFIKSLPTEQSRYVTAFYENNKEISQAYADMRHYAELGDTEKVQKILEEKGDKIALSKMYDKTAKEMAKVRAQIRVITNDPNMDSTTKREMIDRMKQIISGLSEQAESARKALK